MRLRLKNFRCHEDREFTFEDSGLALLGGKTGQGKSTILEAIYFALYGEVKKPYTFGANSCRVDLDIYDMKIVRTCRPNRLLVEFDNAEYEDAEAQSIINSQVMNLHEFLASSYIRQKSNCSILAMTPTEQVQFIKNIAFDADTNIKVKTIIKDMIKDIQEDLIKAKKNLEFAESQILDLDEDESQYEIQENPLESQSSEELDKEDKNIKFNIS